MSPIETLWEDGATRHHAYLVEAIAPGEPATRHALAGIRALGFSPEQAWGLIDRQATTQALLNSADDLFFLSGVIFIGLIVVPPPPTSLRAANGGMSGARAPP